MPTTDVIFLTLCHGGSPVDNDLRQFCKDATDEQLRTVLSVASPQDVRRLDIVENELASRRHNAMAGHLTATVKKLEELKKPHWTIPWSFWLLWVTMVIALWSWLFPRQPVSDTSNSPKSQQPVAAPASAASSSNPIVTVPQTGALKHTPTPQASPATNSVALPVAPKR